LRLKNHLGITSGEFLGQYTSQHIGPETGLPVVTLKPEAGEDRLCPFVSPEGCRVYTNRPSSCRTYPLVRGLSRSRETGEVTEQFMMLQEPHCLGFREKSRHTVRQWIANQEIRLYNEINDRLMEIISLKNQLIPGSLDLKSQRMFYLALYDLDNFRTQIKKNGLLDDFDCDQTILEKSMEDDVELLELGMRWIKLVLFEN
jgi:Fe-S-cluster containining protein